MRKSSFFQHQLKNKNKQDGAEVDSQVAYLTKDQLLMALKHLLKVCLIL